MKKKTSKRAPRLITRKDVAAKLEVVQGTVTKWELAGLPVAVPGRRGTPSLFNLVDVKKWLRERDRKARETGSFDLNKERARKEHAQALVAEQTVAVRAGDLMVRAEVEQVWTTEIAAVRSKLLSWPAVLSEQLGRAFELGGVVALENKLQAAVEELLTELSTGAAQAEEQPAPRKAPSRKPSSRKKASRKKAAKKKPSSTK